MVYRTDTTIREKDVQKMLLLITTVNGYTNEGSGFVYIFELLRSVLYKFRNSPVIQQKVSQKNVWYIMTQLTRQ
jgi:hypothetical protein